MSQNRAMKLISTFITISLLLTACARPGASETAPPTASLSSPSPSPAITYAVKTDYTGLTAYEPIEEICTRLSPDYMPELIPSEDYGLLLPYVGQTFSSSIFIGWDLSYKGLITADGVKVTDDVYSEAYQASYRNGYRTEMSERIDMPVYILARPPVPDPAIDPFCAYALHAVCALDGSWITPFEYKKVFCCDKVLLLERDYETLDVDVMSYDGKILYNLKDLSCRDKLPPGFYHNGDGIFTNYGEGYFAVADGFLEELTGKFIQVKDLSPRNFYEGLAAVYKDGLWGYIDRNFNMVIPPQFQIADGFKDGLAWAEYPSGQSAVIDKAGMVILKGGYLDPWYDTFISNNMHENDFQIFDQRGQQVYAAKAGDTFINVGNGIYGVASSEATLLFYQNQILELPAGSTVTSVKGNYLTYVLPDEAETILRSLDGSKLITLDGPAAIKEITESPDGKMLFILSNMDWEKPAYSVAAADGTILFTGKGSAAFNEASGLICIRDETYFAYCDTAGHIVFRVSLLDCVPD